jgi:phage anti-repressor protein
MDSSFAVRKIDMSVNSNINLNWVKDLKIIQDFEKSKDGNWLLTSDELSIDFGLAKNKMGFFGQRAVLYKDYQINKPRGDSLYSGLSLVVNPDANKQSSEYWEKNRFVELSKSEKGTYTVIDSVKKVPAFRRTMDIILLLLQGYKDIGYFDIGPVSTFYSYNPIEGFRLRFGGRTTDKFSKKINLESYIAYGFKDELSKYYLGASYSFTERNVFDFPVKSMKICYQDETLFKKIISCCQ